VYITGGSVRDHLLNISSKDIDLEVHGVTHEQLNRILQEFRPIKAVGKSFGVWKLLPLTETELEIDVALPHHEGIVYPDIGIEEACRRRDLTINAMLIHVQTQTLVDIFGGQEDLNSRILRATDPQHFATDLLRVFRVCQFAARLHCSISTELQHLCLELTQRSDFIDLPKERVWTELEKGWLKSPDPHIAVEWLLRLNALQRYLPAFTTFTSLDPLDPLEPLKQYRVLDRLKKGAAFRDPDNRGRTMGLFWALLTLDLSIEDTVTTMAHMGIEKYMGFPLVTAVLRAKECVPMLTTTHSTVVQNLCREKFDLNFLCDVASSVETPSGNDKNHSEANRSEAQQRDIIEAPLPNILNGRDLLALGYKGMELGKWLHKIRLEQLHERIQSKSDALQWIQENQQ
jgi:hypothetical protein